MIIKKKAILRGLKFTRVFWKYEKDTYVCTARNCLFKDMDICERKLNNISCSEKIDPCEICGRIMFKTKTGFLEINYSYIVKNKIERKK